MKKPATKKAHSNKLDEMLSEYDFDYNQAKSVCWSD
jgi:hypothetical protein